MSQKSTRRGRRQTHEEDLPIKQTQKKSNGVEENVKELPPPAPVEEKPETNGSSENKHDLNNTDGDIVTRSRSQTPQNKKNDDKSMNGNDLDVANEEIVNTESEHNETKTSEDDIVLNNKDPDSDMDPLILSDDPDPELVFEENSDLESGKSSPTLFRSKTRRSLTRNIPTPKTPKSVDEAETPPPLEPEVQPSQELNNTFESCSENTSTHVEVGGDSTRLDNIEDSNTENSFLNLSKNRSLGETLRNLSTRRSIRPISDEYRKRAIHHNLDKTDYSASYPTRNSVDRISLGGLKRKNGNDSDEESSKRFKGDTSPGFFARLASPLNSIRNSFRSDLPSSTPKLTGYKDENCLIGDDGKVCEINEERRWCSIM